MGDVCVITGGGSGMGLATAKLVGRHSAVLIAGRTLAKLEAARAELRALGIDAEAVACDVADRAAVDRLAARARALGTVTAVVHSAGLSPHMGDARGILEGNALGTIHVNEAFSAFMGAGSCIVDVASMAGHLLPGLLLPTKDYALSRTDQGRFVERMLARVNLFPRAKRPGLAYGISKNFVLWYARTDAVRLGQRGIRVLSVSPGTFETPMAELEKEATSGYANQSPLGRIGRVEEIASVLAFCVGDQAGYLTGVDILCDGGCTAVGFHPLKDKLQEATRGLWGGARQTLFKHTGEAP
jgi:NAD(P)-dependent dehydrogenase (short-subunit alcohol dehydrogenase family)